MAKRQPRQARRQPEPQDRPQDRPREEPEDRFQPPDFEEAPIHDWLEPIGNTGFYQSPLEPVDPHDCDRWPDSPYCDDSSPVSFDNFIDLVPQFTYNNCEICVTVAPTLSYLSLPPYTICKRSSSPQCVPMAPDPPVNPGEDEFPPRQPYRRRCPDGSEIFIGLREDSDPEYTGGLSLPRGTEIYAVWEALEAVGRAQAVESISANEYAEGISVGVEPLGAENFLSSTSSQWAVFKSFNGELQQLAIPALTTVRVPYYYFVYWFDSYYESDNRAPVGPRQEISFFPWDEACGTVGPPPRQVTPPPYGPPLNEGPCCMACSQESEQLLRLIAKRLGTEDYPASVPKSLLTGRERGQQKIESLTQLIGWFVQQVDALVGEFPVELTIEDIDPTKPGKQSKKVAVPNIAEAIAELYGLALKNTVDSDIHTNFMMRLAAEIIATKNAAIVTQDYARANATFLGYKANPKKRKVNYAFDPEGLESLETILTESVKYVQGWQEDDPETVVGFLQRIVFSAGIIKAAFLRNKDQLGNLKGDIDNLLNKSEGDQDELWRQFLRAVENPDHRFNQGNVPTPEIKDLSQTSNEGLSNLLGEQT